MCSVVTAVRFLPAMMVLPVWLAIALQNNLLVVSFQTYYPLSVAMMFGSVIAGSTPLGGGVVAFPTCVLLLGFDATQGRDFSLLIQSVGMTGASFLIVTQKPELLREFGHVVAKSALFSVLGLVVGVSLTIPTFVVMCIYTTSVASFAMILAYVEWRWQQQQQQQQRQQTRNSCGIGSSSRQEEETTKNSKATIIESDALDIEDATESLDCKKDTNTLFLDRGAIFAFSFVGGLISSQIGTGADIAWYVYGSLVYNHHAKRKMDGNDLTAASVIVMTVTSIFGTILRISTSSGNNNNNEPPTKEVYQALVACCCIVIIGAPVGSLFLTKDHQRKLKLLFYVLAFVQLVSFGIIKIRTNVVAWSVIGGILGCISVWIAFMELSGKQMEIF